MAAFPLAEGLRKNHHHPTRNSQAKRVVSVVASTSNNIPSCAACPELLTMGVEEGLMWFDRSSLDEGFQIPLINPVPRCRHIVTTDHIFLQAPMEESNLSKSNATCSSST